MSSEKFNIWNGRHWNNTLREFQENVVRETRTYRMWNKEGKEKAQDWEKEKTKKDNEDADRIPFPT